MTHGWLTLAELIAVFAFVFAGVFAAMEWWMRHRN
jgi:hypothetical protein